VNIPEFREGQWVRSTEFGDIGYVERADSKEGPYEIRLLTQWDQRTLPERSGGGFELMTLPEVSLMAVGMATTVYGRSR